MWRARTAAPPVQCGQHNGLGGTQVLDRRTPGFEIGGKALPVSVGSRPSSPERTSSSAARGITSTPIVCKDSACNEAGAIWSASRRLDIDAAIAVEFEEATLRRAHPAGLSERETDVVRLVAECMPNKAIAARLHVSVRTVESHVRQALAKVGLENRTQLAGWARGRIQ